MKAYTRIYSLRYHNIYYSISSLFLLVPVVGMFIAAVFAYLQSMMSQQASPEQQGQQKLNTHDYSNLMLPQVEMKTNLVGIKYKLGRANHLYFQLRTEASSV